MMPMDNAGIRGVRPYVSPLVVFSRCAVEFLGPALPLPMPFVLLVAYPTVERQNAGGYRTNGGVMCLVRPTC